MLPYEQLEKEYAKFAGTLHSVSCSSGTSALHLALLALGIGPGDEVIIPDFTMGACGFAVAYTGAKVVTVDCDDTLNIDVTKIEEKITEKTKAIMAVHIYGRLCNMQAIREIAKKHNLKVIEDGCEAQGAAKGGNSDCLIFSFYRNKIIRAEEGGIVCTNSKELADDMRDLKNMAFGERHDYFHTRIGYNYRMADSQAKLALQSLADFPTNEVKRREFEKFMEKKLPSGLPRRDAVWVYDFICSYEAIRNEMFNEYKEMGMNPRLFFKPLSTMPMFSQDVGEKALRYSQIGMYLPVDLNYTPEV